MSQEVDNQLDENYEEGSMVFILSAFDSYDDITKLMT